jgi:hypothetical protein
VELPCNAFGSDVFRELTCSFCNTCFESECGITDV